MGNKAKHRQDNVAAPQHSITNPNILIKEEIPYYNTDLSKFKLFKNLRNVTLEKFANICYKSKVYCSKKKLLCLQPTQTFKK